MEYFPRIQYVAAQSKVYCFYQARHQRISQEELNSCRCSTTSHGDQAEDLEEDNGHLLVPGSEKKWHSIKEDSPQGIWDNLSVVESGQYFMTKDTADLSQFHAVACREYNLRRDEETSEPKGWIQGNTKIGPVLEVATSYLHGKYGVEI